MATALIVDDERDICDLIEMGIRSQVSECDSVYNIKSALKKLKEKQYDLIISDVRLPDGDGMDLLAHVQKNYPDTPICMITAHGNMEMAIKALKLGAFDFIQKPFDIKQLRAVCKSALDGKNQPKETKTTKKSEKSASAGKHQLIGDSEAMEALRLMIARVSKSQAPVFIHGESGTGKEVVAQSIHNSSPRAGAPFIAVNCGAIPENLMESEFFGYKKGAFTGANQDTNGLFVAANGGTLFLDEVADLPLAMQVKLLRAIQERAVRPIGGDKEETVDVRIISATHKNLADCVENRSFREDLYYRLNVISLNLPPLRDRLDDIPQLAEFLLKRLIKNGNYQNINLSPEALEKLQSYSFPGNVRELENILERALTFADQKSIRPDDISLGRGEKITPKAPSDEGKSMGSLERKIILQALKENQYDVIATAQELGMTFQDLNQKLKAMGLEI